MKSSFIYFWIAIICFSVLIVIVAETWQAALIPIIILICLMSLISWSYVMSEEEDTQTIVRKLTHMQLNKESYWEYVGQSDGDSPKEVYRCAHCKRLIEVASKSQIYEIKYCDKCGTHLVYVKVGEGKEY